MGMVGISNFSPSRHCLLTVPVLVEGEAQTESRLDTTVRSKIDSRERRPEVRFAQARIAEGEARADRALERKA